MVAVLQQVDFLINKKGEQELVASTDLPHSLKIIIVSI